MPDLSPYGPYLIAALHCLVALLWTALGRSYCRCHGTSQLRTPLLRLFRSMAWMFALHYGAKTLVDFQPPPDSLQFQLACWVAEVSMVVLLVILRHLVPLGILGAPRPGRIWLLTNYGLGLIGLAMVGYRSEQPVDAFDLYLTVFTALILWDMVRFARGGRRPVLMADLRFGGYLALSLVLFGGVLVLGLTERVDSVDQRPIWLASHILVGLVAALPFALRILGEVVRSLLVYSGHFVLAVGLFAFFRYQAVPTMLGGGLVESLGAGLGPIHAIDLLAGLLAVALLGSDSGWLPDWVDRVVLRQEHDWRRRLNSVAHGLSPEVGIEGVCRRALGELSALMRVPGAGIVLEPSPEAAAGGRTVIVVGELDLEEVAELWPEEAEGRMPKGAFDLLWLDDEALQTVLYDARVTWVVAIGSPRRHWGHLFVSPGLLGNSASHSRLEGLEDLARGLALALDSADLLARVRTAERELARTEKLAALGETAARIAHEVRNPVTAARSLAQLMADEPTSPLNREHASLVVGELDRVEQRVRSMLEFAREECLRTAPVELGEWVRTTLGELEGYFEHENVEARFDAGGEEWVVAGDRERLRQVLVNLITNGVEAQCRAEGPRRLELSIARSGHNAELRVSDHGPGVVEELADRLFEPFVSSKAKGTGLGLAISRRIIEAHGGTLEASRGSNGGMVMRALLPLIEKSEPLASAPERLAV